MTLKIQATPLAGGGPMTLKIRWSLQAENLGLKVVPLS
jgi:hypothetical protein